MNSFARANRYFRKIHYRFVPAAAIPVFSPLPVKPAEPKTPDGVLTPYGPQNVCNGKQNPLPARFRQATPMRARHRISCSPATSGRLSFQIT